MRDTIKNILKEHEDKRINQALEVGDIIELIYMDDPYNPISPLTKGVVMGFEAVPGGKDKILVTWIIDPENDKMYNMPMIPEVDVWRKVDVEPSSIQDETDVELRYKNWKAIKDGATPTGADSRTSVGHPRRLKDDDIPPDAWPVAEHEHKKIKRTEAKSMKTIELTEDTLHRIIERVIKEQDKEEANKKLMVLFQKKRKGEDVDEEIKNLLIDNPHLKDLQGAVTQKGKEEIKKA